MHTLERKECAWLCQSDGPVDERVQLRAGITWNQGVTYGHQSQQTECVTLAKYTSIRKCCSFMK